MRIINGVIGRLGRGSGVDSNKGQEPRGQGSSGLRGLCKFRLRSLCFELHANVYLIDSQINMSPGFRNSFPNPECASRIGEAGATIDDQVAGAHKKSAPWWERLIFCRRTCKPEKLKNL